MTTTTKFSPDLTTATPAEIDGQLFPILGKLADAQLRFTRAQNTEERINEEIEAAKIAGRSGSYTEKYVLPDAMAATAAAEVVMAEAEDAAQPFEAEYERRGGWERYIVVAGGHLHYSRCHTLTPGRTMAGAVAEASGLDQPQVVGHFGETACTHCFPDAPVAAKKTPAEEGYCQHSGEYVAERYVAEGKLEADWYSYCVARSVRCDCGHVSSITKAGKLRKHKAAS